MSIVFGGIAASGISASVISFVVLRKKIRRNTDDVKNRSKQTIKEHYDSMDFYDLYHELNRLGMIDLDGCLDINLCKREFELPIVAQIISVWLRHYYQNGSKLRVIFLKSIAPMIAKKIIATGDLEWERNLFLELRRRCHGHLLIHLRRRVMYFRDLELRRKVVS